jgi:F0F1-type ATP synthase membrane subunit b/b'
MNKTLMIVFSTIIFCLLIVLGGFIANPVNADSYDDDIETQRQQAEAEEEEFYILLEDAEDDHNNGIENTDSDHSLEEHNNRYGH